GPPPDILFGQSAARPRIAARRASRHTALHTCSRGARMQPGDGSGPLVLAALLLAKHFVCDFVLQSPYQLRNKGRYGHPGGLLHAGIHALGSAAILAFFPLGWTTLLLVAAAEFVIHYHIDWSKERIVAGIRDRNGAAFWAIFGFDQLLHHLTYIAMAILVR